MKIHFIAIGGSVMHSLAIALLLKGNEISGSDDEFFEPSKSRLASYGILPEKQGWYPEKLSSEIDAVILGMHAKQDNPELLKAIELGLPIYSYPEYIYKQAVDKLRVVVGGSHGKTTVTSMVMHVLKNAGHEFDYLVGARLEGFDQMLQLSNAPLMIIEGDEYLSSPIDKRPKFMLYNADIGLINGIAWDHINVFPDFEIYVQQFKDFINSIIPGGTLIYCNSDPILCNVVKKSGFKGILHGFSTHPHKLINGKTFLIFGKELIPVSVFGIHNLKNINAAYYITRSLNIKPDIFYHHISSFKGASRRLELIAENESTAVYYDFAHSPSKLKATINAVRERYLNRKIIVCFELHTYSSLSNRFLGEYRGSLDSSDIAFIFFNQSTLALKDLPEISNEEIKQGFGKDDIRVYTDIIMLRKNLLNLDLDNSVFVMMSSGNFNGLDITKFGAEIIS